MGRITEQAFKILESYPQIIQEPASVSGKYHNGETTYQHLYKSVEVMKMFCTSLNINDEDTDMLVAATWLHDIGKTATTKKGKPSKKDEEYYDYYPATGWSRLKNTIELHPISGAMLIDGTNIDGKDEIKDLIKTHMGHWYPNCPQPKTFYQKLLVMADYIATKYKNGD